MPDEPSIGEQFRAEMAKPEPCMCLLCITRRLLETAIAEAEGGAQ